MTALDAPTLGIAAGLTLAAAGDLAGVAGVSVVGAALLALSLLALFALMTTNLLTATRRAVRRPDGMLDRPARLR